MKTLIVLPTYNERHTLPALVRKIFSMEGLDVHVLVVDDNSSDGTAEAARALALEDSRLSLIERPGKLGLGTAYLTGFAWGLERDFQCFVEMDSDLSHNAFGLPGFLAEIEKGADLVIGSRYLGGTISVVGWDFRRLLLSKFGNFYAATILRLPLSDITSGYRAFSRQALEHIPLESIHSEGYAFQIEMAYNVWQAGLSVKEIPITFTERRAGVSKMSKAIIREAVWLPWMLRLRGTAGLGLRLLAGRGAHFQPKDRRL